jgi:hypothetical protein
MASLPVRDPVGDQLLTPQNAALLVIDYQPSQFEGVNSIETVQTEPGAQPFEV